VASAEVEQLGDLGHGLSPGVHVAHGAAGVAVPGLGHNRYWTTRMFQIYIFPLQT